MKELKDYKVGDMVICNGVHDNPEIKNSIGKVLYNNNGTVGIEFKENIRGHDASGKAKYGHGWNIYDPSEIKPYGSTSKHLRQLNFESYLSKKEELPFDISLLKEKELIPSKDKFYAVKVSTKEEVNDVVNIGLENGYVLYNIDTFKSAVIREISRDVTCINLGDYDDRTEISFSGKEYYETLGRYIVISYKDFMNKYKKSTSKNLRQLNFESFINEAERKFKVGDRVIRTNRFNRGFGEKATVKGYSNNFKVIIEFDKPIGMEGITYDDLTKAGYGWSCTEDSIKLIKSISKNVRQLNFNESQIPLPLNQKWYKSEYDKEYRFDRIVCRKCGKENVDDNKITKRVGCPECGFKGGLPQ